MNRFLIMVSSPYWLFLAGMFNNYQLLDEADYDLKNYADRVMSY